MACLLCLVLCPGAVLAEQSDVLNPPITRGELFAKRSGVSAVIGEQWGGLAAKPAGDGRWTIAGTLKGGSGGVRFKPTKGAWDFTGYSLFSIRMTNRGPGVVWVEARLENGGAVDWAHSSSSQSYILPGETGVVTVGYPQGGHRDDSAPLWANMAAKPNGWRSHWKPFNPGDIKNCRFVVRSSHPDIRLTLVEPYLAWPYGKTANKKLITIPYLDRFGQPIVFDWPTKIKQEEELRRQRGIEAQQISQRPKPASFNRFGGHIAGPQLKATGYFRTAKHKGKWWLVDPDGRLFWSHGVCSVSNNAGTPIKKNRRALFAWLPEPGSAEHKAGVIPKKNAPSKADFLRLNTRLKYGQGEGKTGWEASYLDTTHKRIHAWGLNTLGSWSDAALYKQQRTPYTEIVHIWHGPHSIDGAADPYEKGFVKRFRDAVASVAKTKKEDPWMIGLFIDNEVHWHNDMIERILKRGPKQPAYAQFVERLKKKYKTLADLNTAWKTNAKSWDALTAGKTQAWRADRDGFYRQLADHYYATCRKAMDDLLPNHLYLGSRVHHCPRLVADQIAKHVDVFSVNHYWPLANTGQMPGGVDKPAMITEFHFGTIDRGVLGMSLCPVHDQTQRARNYAAYVSAALIHPKIVGTHYFAYTDQSAIGRPGENYQIGLIDITDTPYPEMTAMTRAVGERMYPLRLKEKAKLLDEVSALIRKAKP